MPSVTALPLSYTPRQEDEGNRILDKLLDTTRGPRWNYPCRCRLIIDSAAVSAPLKPLRRLRSSERSRRQDDYNRHNDRIVKRVKNGIGQDSNLDLQITRLMFLASYYYLYPFTFHLTIRCAVQQLRCHPSFCPPV